MVQKVQLERKNSGQSFGLVLASAGLASLLAACSADISRFNFNDKPTTTGALPNSAAPTPAESVYADRSALGRPAQRDPFDAVERRDLSTPSGASPYDTTSRYDTSSAPAQPLSADRQRTATWSAPATPAPPANTYSADASPRVLNDGPTVDPVTPSQGQSIFVRRGDTLYGLSRRHGTSVAALMSTNNLNSSALKPGQKLFLPSDATQASAPTRAEDTVQAPVVQAQAPTHWSDTYTIQSGDSLYRLSRRYNVKIAELKQYNNIQNPRALRPGMVLKVPGPGGNDGSLAESLPAKKVATRRVQTRPIAVSPTILNGANANAGIAKETQVAAVKPSTSTDALKRSGQSVTVRPETTRNSIAGTSKLRWPVRGRIISGFGKRNDGTHNDGINVAVPLGTKIHAAEDGMVAYAGDELKGYGNLVLIRHDNGWVTAYAHAERLMVKRGDRIRRGDVIAQAGKTGDVEQPQVHFEVRQGQKPVDPVPFMDRL